MVTPSEDFPVIHYGHELALPGYHHDYIKAVVVRTAEEVLGSSSVQKVWTVKGLPCASYYLNENTQSRIGGQWDQMDASVNLSELGASGPPQLRKLLLSSSKSGETTSVTPSEVDYGKYDVTFGVSKDRVEPIDRLDRHPGLNHQDVIRLMQTGLGLAALQPSVDYDDQQSIVRTIHQLSEVQTPTEQTFTDITERAWAIGGLPVQTALARINYHDPKKRDKYVVKVVAAMSIVPEVELGDNSEITSIPVIAEESLTYRFDNPLSGDGKDTISRIDMLISPDSFVEPRAQQAYRGLLASSWADHEKNIVRSLPANLENVVLAHKIEDFSNPEGLL